MTRRSKWIRYKLRGQTKWRSVDENGAWAGNFGTGSFDKNLSSEVLP
jgi:hypothetical protein